MPPTPSTTDPTAPAPDDAPVVPPDVAAYMDEAPDEPTTLTAPDDTATDTDDLDDFGSEVARDLEQLGGFASRLPSPPEAPADLAGETDPEEPEPEAPVAPEIVGDSVVDDAEAVGEVSESTPAAGPPVGGYTLHGADGQDYHLTDDQVRQALGVQAWAESLPQDARAAVDGVTSGQAVAIPRAEFDAYMAWRSQQQRSTRDADLDTYDPDAAQEIARLRDEIAQTRGQQPYAQSEPYAPQPQQYAQEPPAGQVQAPDGRLQPIDPAAYAADTQAFETAMASYADSHGLTADEVDRLMGAAVPFIPQFMESLSTRNPATGQVLARADLAQVTNRALDFALTSDPALHTRVLEHMARPPAADGAPAPGAPALQAVPTQASTVDHPEEAPEDPVLAKRARAASLASAPSAAVAPSPRDVSALSGPDRVAAMAAFIDQQSAAG